MLLGGAVIKLIVLITGLPKVVLTTIMIISKEMAKLIHDINSFRNQICLRTYLFSLLLKKQLSQLFSYFEFLYIIIKSFLRCSFEMNEPVINVPNLKPLKLICSRWR